MDKMFALYLKKHPNAEAIPMMELMGNKVLWDKFNGSQEAVYDYCLENNTTWEEVLGYEFDPNVMY